MRGFALLWFQPIRRTHLGTALISNCQVWYDSFMYVTCLLYVCGIVRFVCLTWLVHIYSCDLNWFCALTRGLFGYRIVMCVCAVFVIWLIPVWHDSCMCASWLSYVTWLIHAWHDSFICDMTHSCVTWLIHMWHNSFICNVNRHTIVISTDLQHLLGDRLDIQLSGVNWLIDICDMTHWYL